MPFEYITDTPLIRRLVAHDRPSQIALTQKLWRLNLQVMELLAQQPGFEAFVQAQFDQHFSALTPRLPVRKSYVQSREWLPATTAEMPLPPTLLDAVGGSASWPARRRPAPASRATPCSCVRPTKAAIRSPCPR